MCQYLYNWTTQVAVGEITMARGNSWTYTCLQRKKLACICSKEPDEMESSKMQGISQVSRAWLDLCFSAPGQTAAWLSKCFLLQRGCLSTQYSAFAWGLYLSFPWLVSVGTTHRAAGVCGACCGWPCCRVLAVRLACSAVVEGRTVMLAPLLCPRFSCGA